MNSQSISSPERFDELRASNPDLAINLYAMTPGGVVMLEIITPDGKTYNWQAETAEAAYEMAFPVPAVLEKEADVEQQSANIFD